jgi:hypothetical protein
MITILVNSLETKNFTYKVDNWSLNFDPCIYNAILLSIELNSWNKRNRFYYYVWMYESLRARLEYLIFELMQNNLYK